jgi:ammonia channel protein AmtB
VFLGDAGTLITYPDHHLLCCDDPHLALDPHGHGGVWGTLLESIANEVVQHLLDPERGQRRELLR